MTRASETASARTGPVPGPLGRAIEVVYRAAVARRNRRFDAGIGVRRLPFPVISVGNLSVGGTGKTPMARWVIETLRVAGLTPALALRGYRAREGLSDEAAEHRSLLPAIEIAVGPDRFASLMRLAEVTRIDAAALDDGFQRRDLHRDLDIVLLDATRDPFRDRCLPAGWLREPVASLARAQAVVITHAEAAEERAVQAIRDRTGAIAPRALITLAAHAWAGLEGVPGHAHAPVSWLAGRRALVVCAIGNPEPFVDQARRAGAEVVHVELRRDHSSYDAADVRGLAARALRDRADCVLTTAKDWVKLAPLVGTTPGAPFVRPTLTLEFPEGNDALRELVLRAARVDPQGFSDARSQADQRSGVLRS